MMVLIPFLDALMELFGVYVTVPSPPILHSSQFCISNIHEKTAFVGAYIVGSRNGIKKPQEYVSVIAPNN